MQRPLHLFLLVLLGIGVFPVQAQIAFGGRPYGPIGAKLGWGAPATLELPPIDVPALMAEDAERAASGLKGPDRFGYVHDVRAALEDRGTWTQLPNGDRTWRLVVHCPGAIGIGLAFDTYVVPDGARLFVYNDMGEVRGGFTAASNPGFQALGVAPIPGDRITIEYDEPAAVAVVEGELWVAYEAERLPLGRIIDGLLRHDPNCQELGQRLHTRVDIEWGVG